MIDASRCSQGRAIESRRNAETYSRHESGVALLEKVLYTFVSY